APRAGRRRGTADAPPRPRRRRAGRAHRRARGPPHRLGRLRGWRGARGAGRARDAPHRRLDPAPLERERRALEAAPLPLARGGRPRLVLALCLALAMLAKGPVGPGLVGLTALVSALANWRPGPALRLVRPLPVLVFLAVAGGWYGLAYHHRGMDFVAKQIISENGEALLGSARFPYRSPFFYLAPLVLGGLPWTLVLPWALARGWRSGDLARRHAVA